MPPASKPHSSEVGGSSFDPIAELLAMHDERPAQLSPALLALREHLLAEARRWLDEEHRLAVQRGEQWGPGQYPRFCEAVAGAALLARADSATAADDAVRLRIAAGPVQHGPQRLRLQLLTTPQETT